MSRFHIRQSPSAGSTHILTTSAFNDKAYGCYSRALAVQPTRRVPYSLFRGGEPKGLGPYQTFNLSNYYVSITAKA
jgi:hypothetical protein